MMQKVFELIDAKLTRGERILLAIDGDAAAGKSTLAARLAKHYGCAVIHMDDFFLPPVLRTPERMAQAGGNVDYERFGDEVLEPLMAGQAFSYRPFDCKMMNFVEKKSVEAAAMTIVEGAYSLHPNLAHAYTLKIFMGIDGDEQMRRITARNGADMAEKFEKLWIPMEKRYQEAFGIRESCDLVLE